ncbi:putative CRISPR-associated helicase Cas3, Anaes-subtype [Candidatus Sulfopaludibacter sp. SbA4]|nr:putative CRISPR-associated helicase Cas3, Anaes-subtype [Candidatus Sulfopaludibacter sp. SbA4]
MTFSEFFKTVWNYEPFPWQELLAAKALQGEWPRSIGLPTAAGKTALIDIAVYALAMRAPKAARRIFFVVDRRVIVDEAAERAEKLASRLRDATPDSELGSLAQKLRDLGGGEPLITTVLRGGIPRDDSWKDSPLQPAVICSTVDQVGSSLLFRAYGASEYGRPIRAGLAAYDSLIILDEAHTSHAFAETLGWIGKYRGWAEQPVDLPLTVVEMSATPRGEAFRETAKDLENGVLRRRWEAGKKARLVVVEAKEQEEAVKGGFTALVEGIAREARVMRDERGAKVIGVIANRVLTARSVHNALRTDEGCASILLTGRSRPYDRDAIWEKWGPQIELGRCSEPDRPVFVVATQCIEVGANLDFDALVTEIASLDALEQRFGRLDRDGRWSEKWGTTYAAIVAQKDQTAKKYEDAIYGGAIGTTWAWLKDHLTKHVRTEVVPGEGKKKPRTRKIKEDFVEMGVLSLRKSMGETTDRGALTMPAKQAPVLMPAHLDLLSQTSPEPAVSPDAAVFLHGPETGPPDVEVVWRADIEGDPGKWRDIVSICPPSAAEGISLPVWVVRSWLADQGAADLGDIEGVGTDRSRAGGKMRRALRWLGPDESELLRAPAEVRPGMTIIVPSSYGGCDEWGWNPVSTARVCDVGDAVKLLMERPMLRFDPQLAAQWDYIELAGRLKVAEDKKAVKGALAEVGGQSAGWVREAVTVLGGCPLRILKLIDDSEDEDAWAAVTGKAALDQNDFRSSYSAETGLDEHLRGCKELATVFARDLSAVVRNTIVRAAALHDIGKADPRFQAWLRGGNPVKPGELIAKSGSSGQNWAAIERARRLAGYPKGGRHELMSVALLQEHRAEFADVDFDLLLHLVGSHHGRCRPFAPVVVDPERLDVRYGDWRGGSDHGLERVGSGVSERFWQLTQRYGWYGLAYLESMVRIADQRRSEAEQEKGADGKGAHE